MATLEQHMKDCVRFLGAPYQEVHEWIDAFSSRLGPLHRRVRHHREGIAEVRSTFGDGGARAAIVHILRDCRNIPYSGDYSSGRVDVLGLRKAWPVTAYIRYPDHEFEELVMTELHGPTGVVLWAFADEAAIALIASVSRLTADEVGRISHDWPVVLDARERLPKLISSEIAQPISSDAVLSYVSEVSASPLFTRIREDTPNAQFAMVDLDDLITPLVYIDKEHVEELKAELQGDDETSVARFSIPLVVSSKIRAALDPTMTAVTFISPQKTMTVGPVQVRQTPDGVEVRFIITNGFSAIVVGKLGGRYYLRNGIHRSYLLRSRGIRSAPCLLIEEEVPPPMVIQSYPTFTAQVLGRDRPPLLRDYFEKSLTIEVPLQKTQKIIKISPDQTIVPID